MGDYPTSDEGGRRGIPRPATKSPGWHGMPSDDKVVMMGICPAAGIQGGGFPRSGFASATQAMKASPRTRVMMESPFGEKSHMIRRYSSVG